MTPFDELMKRLGAQPVDPALLEPFLRAMDEAIADVEAVMRQRAILAEEARRWVIG